jgi:hypothetical protein
MTAKERVLALLSRARRLSDPDDPLGRAARARVPGETGLSRENVELALTEILETHPSEAELAALLGSVSPAPRAHVQLSANVFTAALRALALALAQSAQVAVRPSRRERAFPELLCAELPWVKLVEALRPEPGDHLWAYGSDATLEAVSQATRAGVTLHAHGSGFGVAIIDSADAEAAALLTRDVVPFDQRGCSSPRVALVLGDEDDARAFARAVAQALSRAAQDVPLGRLGDAERAEQARFRETLSYVGEVFEAGPGVVALDGAPERLIEAPVGRNVVVVRTGDGLGWLADHRAKIIAAGVSERDELRSRVRAELPDARVSALGRMQRPLLDGPVDGRGVSRPRVLGPR